MRINRGPIGWSSRNALGAALLVGVLLATACASSAPSGPAPATSQPQTSKEPQRGGILKITGCNFATQDVHQNLANVLHACLGLAYSGLLRFETGPDVPATSARIIPDMAEKWEQPDSKTFIFHLRKNIKWQNLPPVNGRAFTADDVVYSIERLRTPGWVHSAQFTALDKVEKVDDYTVKMTLKEPSAPFLSMIAVGYTKMVAKEAVQLKGDLQNGPTIGTGPFMVDKMDSNQQVELKRNPDFYEAGVPYLDGMKITNIADASTAKSAFRTKQLDYDGLDNSEVKDIKNSMPTINIVHYAENACYFVGLKMDRPPFNDLKVRTAVDKAINRSEIIDTIYFGSGWLNSCLPAPDTNWSIPEDQLKKHYTYDPDGAKKLLAEAGYANGFEVEFTVPRYSEAVVSEGELLQSQLAKVGIKANIKIIPSPQYTAQILTKPGNFNMMFGPTGTFAEPDQWLTSYFHSKGARNAQDLSDSKFDAMIDAQRVETDTEKRRKLILDIQQYVLDQRYMPVLHGYWTNVGMWPWLQGFSPMRDYGGFRQFRLYWFDKTAPGYPGS